MHVDQTMNPASLDPSASAIAFLLIIQALQNLTTQMVPWSTRGAFMCDTICGGGGGVVPLSKYLYNRLLMLVLRS